MNNTFSTLLVLCLLLGSALPAQEESQDGMLQKMANAFTDPVKPMETPEAMRTDEKEKIRFYFTALEPAKPDLNLYIRKGTDAIQIRPAYDTFGMLHELPKRNSLIFYEKVVIKEGDEEKVSFVPIFQAQCSSGRFLIIYRPVTSSGTGTPASLPTINLSSKRFPYGSLTFFNPQNYPLVIEMDGQSKNLIPGETFSKPFTIRSRGAGYVQSRLFKRNQKGKMEKVLDTRIGMFEKSRGIGIPYLDSSGEGMGFLVHREMQNSESQ